MRALLEGHGYAVHFVFVAADDPDDHAAAHQAFAATLDTCYEAIRAIQREARAQGVTHRPRWPAMVLRTRSAGPGRRMTTSLQRGV